MGPPSGHRLRSHLARVALFGDAVDFFCAAEEVGASDAEPAQGSLDPAGFVDRLGFGELPGRLNHLWVTALRGA